MQRIDHSSILHWNQKTTVISGINGVHPSCDNNLHHGINTAVLWNTHKDDKKQQLINGGLGLPVKITNQFQNSIDDFQLHMQSINQTDWWLPVFVVTWDF